MSRFLEKQNGSKNDEQDNSAQIRACTQEFCRRFAQSRRAETQAGQGA
jgi:hypothetical protein